MIFQSKQIKGDGIGKKSVVPTINVETPLGFSSHFETGVYAAYLYHEGKRYKSALHFGPRPTFDKTKLSLEIHVLAKKIPKTDPNSVVEFEIIKKIRPTQSFDSPETLKNQISKDITEILSILE